MALAYLHELGDAGAASSARQRWGARGEAVWKMLDVGLNAPWTSSCGRLFDAVAVWVGLRERVSYEGQAAIELEMALHRRLGGFSPEKFRETACVRYSFVLRKRDGLWELDWEPMWLDLLADVSAGVDPGEIALRFHGGLGEILVELLDRLREEVGLSTVALSGGCFQNVYLLENLRWRLEEREFRVLTHHLVPPNDGGVALGQAVIAGMHAR